MKIHTFCRIERKSEKTVSLLLEHKSISGDSSLSTMDEEWPKKQFGLNYDTVCACQQILNPLYRTTSKRALFQNKRLRPERGFAELNYPRKPFG